MISINLQRKRGINTREMLTGVSEVLVKHIKKEMI